jgi:hypothetical protein
VAGDTAIARDDRDQGGASSEAASAAPPEPRPSPWNSLEVARLVVTTLTPFAIFCAGAWISMEGRRHDEAIRQDSLARDDQIRQEVAAREDQLRQDELHRDDLLRREAAEREAARRSEADARDERALRESRRRELTTNAQALASQRYMIQVQKRIESWDRLYPCVEDAYSAARRSLAGSPPAAEAADPMARCNPIYAAGSAYFSSGFRQAYQGFAGTVARAAGRDGVGEAALTGAFHALMGVAETDLAMVPGSLGPGEGGATRAR